VEGVVLAGVHAWGECVLESVLCRPLFPVAGYPLIGHTLNWLREGGIRKISICANSDTSTLRRHLGGGPTSALELHYYEDKMPRGPAGCARDAMINSGADTFVVVEGTILPQVNIAELLAAHRSSGAVLTVVVTDREPGRRGCETPQAERLEPVGVYVFSAAALEHVSPRGYQDIKETLVPLLYGKGLRLRTYTVSSAQAPRVTNAASYMAMSKWAVERLAVEGSTPEGYVKIQEALIHESARLHASARFVGPVLIGPHCRIDEDAMVIGPTSVGAGCVIGRQAVVSRSVLWTACQVGAGAVLDQCILTDAAAVQDEMVMREMVCLARPRRWNWTERLRAWPWGTRSRTTVTYVPAAVPAMPVVGKARSPNVVVKSDLKRMAASSAVHGAREGDC